MEEQNKNQNQNEAQEQTELPAIAPAEAGKTKLKFEMYSWFAMLLTFGVFTCSATIIMCFASLQ